MTVRSLCAVAVTAVLLLGTPVGAQEAARVGKIDMQRVFAESKLYQQLAEQLNALAQKLVARLEQRSKRYSLLLDEEWNRLAELLDKGPGLTDAERATMQELQKLNNDRDVELARLEGLPELNEEQRKKYQELVAKRTQAQQGIEDLKARVNQQIKEQDEELTAQFNAKLEAAVEKVALEKKLEVVVQSRFVLYGGLDITDAVLEVLNAEAAGGGGGGGGGNG